MLNLLYLFSLGIIGSFVEATPRATCESFTCDTNTHIPKLPKANFSCAGETCCDSPVCASVNVQEETCGAKGHSTIIEQDDCEAIAIANNKSMITLNFYYLPQGCFNWPDYAEDSYIFNPNEESTIECASDTQCICLNFEDIDSCCIARATCDTATCGASFSLIDDASSTYCENTTCTEEADFDSCCEANESCENIVCNPLTHFTKMPRSDYFCSGECGTTPETTYVSVTENICKSIGYYPVATVYECEKLAQNNNRNYIGSENVANFPAGCYFFGDNSAYLNFNLDSSSECNHVSGCQCIPLDVHTCCTPGEESCNEYTCSDANKVMKDDFTLCEVGSCNDNTCCVDRDTCDSFSCDLETHVPKMPAANFLCAGASCMNHSRVTSFTGVNTTNCIELGYGFADLIECETLADDANRYYAGVLNDTEWPSGCFFHGDSAAAYNVYVNEDISCGAANATCQCKTLVDSQDAKACCKARAKCSSYTCNDVTNVLRHNHSSIICPNSTTESCPESLCCTEPASCDTFECPSGLLHRPNSTARFCQGESCSIYPSDMQNYDPFSFPTQKLTNSSCEAEGYFNIDELACETIARIDGKRFQVRSSLVLPYGCLFDKLGAFYEFNKGESQQYAPSCDTGGNRQGCLCSSFQTDINTCCRKALPCPVNICNLEGGYAPVESHWQKFCANTICKQNEPACCENVPPCRYTSGIYENDERCFCGDQICSKKLNQRYCDITTQTCSTSRGCTPPLKEKNSANDTSKKGCEGSFESVTLSSLYARIGAKELCLSYDSEGWASIEDERICKQVADVFEHPFKVHKTSGYGCSLDEDGILYFGRGVEESVVVNYCMRK